MDFFMPFSFYRTAIYVLIALPCAAADWRSGSVMRFPMIALVCILLASPPSIPYPPVAFTVSFFGSCGGMLSFFIVRKITGNGLGLADIWMAGAVGALGGYLFFVATVLFAILLTLPLMVSKKNIGEKIPFLPALFAGSLLKLFSSFFSAANQ